MSYTSTQVKNRYNKKTYKNMMIRVPTGLGDVLREYIREKTKESIASYMRTAVEDFLAFHKGKIAVPDDFKPLNGIGYGDIFNIAIRKEEAALFDEAVRVNGTTVNFLFLSAICEKMQREGADVPHDLLASCGKVDT